MVHRLVQGIDNAHCQHWSKKFSLPVNLTRGDTLGCQSAGTFTAPQFHPGFSVPGQELFKRGAGDASAEQQSLHSATDTVAATLGIEGNLHCLQKIGVIINKDMAVAIQVLDHWHLRFGADLFDQAFSPTRHNDINELWAGQHSADHSAVSRLQHLNRTCRQIGIGKPLRQTLANGAVRVQRF